MSLAGTPDRAQTDAFMARLLCAMQSRLSAMEKQSRTRIAKMEAARIVNRTKWVLITRLSMDEAAAHRYIEKQAMDNAADIAGCGAEYSDHL